MTQQFSLIIALATIVGCLTLHITLLESLFRGAVVYLVVSIISLIARGQLVRLVSEPEPRQPEENGRAEIAGSTSEVSQ